MFANSEFKVRRFGAFVPSLDSLQQEVQVRIHSADEIRSYESCRAVFTDDGGATNHLSVTQRLPIVNHHLEPAAIHPNHCDIDGLRSAPHFRRWPELWLCGASEERRPHVDDLHGFIGCRISIASLMGLVKLGD